METLLVLFALAVGLLSGWLVARARAARELAEIERSRTALEVELAAERVRLQETGRASARHETFLRDSGRQLEDAFARLARDALKENSEQIVSLSARSVEPLKEALKGLEAKTGELERARATAYGSLEGHLGALQRATDSLKSKSESLETALRGSAQARGRWGELALRNIVDAAGMTPHCDFIEQEAVEGGTRPDMIVRLPEGGGIPIDAKVPLSHYWLASQSSDPDERRGALKRHADAVRRHVVELSKRDYSAFVPGRIDYAVLFLTGDPLLSAAFEHRPELLDEALRNRVLIATPVTLVALLRTAGLLWQQKAVDEGAQKIAEAARELHARVVKFHDHLTRVGRGLEGARRAYNDAIGSWQSRVLPAGRRLEELRGPAGSEARLTELEPVEGELRELPAPE